MKKIFDKITHPFIFMMLLFSFAAIGINELVNGPKLITVILAINMFIFIAIIGIKNYIKSKGNNQPKG